jgi:hypothetical protein
MGMAKFLPTPIDWPSTYYGSNSARQSGRTTRMLQAADYAKRQGERVAIFVDSSHTIDYCGRLVGAHRLCLDPRDFHTAQGGRDGWVLRGVDAQIFLDHYLIELMEDSYSKNRSQMYYDDVYNTLATQKVTNVTGGRHIHDFKYISMDDDEVELWACSCGEQEYRDETD